VTRLRAGRPELDFRKGGRYFLYANASRPTLGPTHPHIQWVPGTLCGGCEVKDAWSYASIPPYIFMALYLQLYVYSDKRSPYSYLPLYKKKCVNKIPTLFQSLDYFLTSSHYCHVDIINIRELKGAKMERSYMTCCPYGLSQKSIS
jgi:hypothetical protein